MLNRIFWVAAGFAAVAEGAVLYTQWPKPPLKVCASFELGDLMEKATRAEAELRAGRASLQGIPNDATSKEVMRLEAAAAEASNAVAKYKKQELDRQKAGGSAARVESCN
jgi:hypothetical protein